MLRPSLSRPSSNEANVVVPGLTLHLGDVLAGRYRIEELVSCEASAVTLHARQVHGREPVTVEVLAGYSEIDHERVEARIVRARVAAHLRSAHVARVLDIGRTPDGMPFVVTTREPGRSIEEELGRRGRFTLEDAVDIAMQLCGALGEAHAHGLVHGDLEPKRVMLTAAPDGSIHATLLGFGVASAIDSLGEASASAWFGSPSYIAPEQAMSGHVDARADIWSIGVLLHELVSGAPPFDGESVSAVLVAVAYDAAPLLTDAPYDLAKIVAQCLAKNPSARPESTEALAKMLAPYAGARGRTRLAEVLSTIDAAKTRAQREAAREAARRPIRSPLAVTREVGKEADRARRQPSPAAMIGHIGNATPRGSAPPPARQVKHLAPVLIEGDEGRDTALPLPLVTRRDQPTTASRRLRSEQRVTKARGIAVVVVAAALGCASAAWASGRVGRALGLGGAHVPNAVGAVRAALVEDDAIQRAPLVTTPFRPNDAAIAPRSAATVEASALPDAPAASPPPKHTASPATTPSPRPTALVPTERAKTRKLPARSGAEPLVRTPPWPSGPVAAQGPATREPAARAPPSAPRETTPPASRLFTDRK